MKIEAEQKLTQARAEAEALRIQKQEVTPELLRLREIEAMLKAIEKWDGKLLQVTGGAVPFLQVISSGQGAGRWSCTRLSGRVGIETPSGEK